MPKYLTIIVAWLPILFFTGTPPVLANDSAAGIAATGIYLKQEENISIEKEVLYINVDKVEVSYTFRNHSDHDISTEVAFPMPDYEWGDPNMPYPLYDDFTVEINGTRVKHQEEIRAFVKKIDYTNLLNELGLSIKKFANFDKFYYSNEPPYYFDKLTQSQQQILLKNNLVFMDGNLAIPNWRVSRKYYWTQVFPAKSTISIQHSYTPYVGAEYAGPAKIIPKACIDNKPKQRLKHMGAAQPYLYVDYILTTANNWKRPIKLFHLIIDGTTSGPHNGNYSDASMCFEKQLKKTGPYRYEVTVPNFIPTKDIRAYFF